MDTGTPWSSGQWSWSFTWCQGAGLPIFHTSAWLHVGREMTMWSGRCRRLKDNDFFTAPTFHMSAWLHMGRKMILLSGKSRLKGNGFAGGAVNKMVSGSCTGSGSVTLLVSVTHVPDESNLRKKGFVLVDRGYRPSWHGVVVVREWEGVTLRSQSQEVKRDGCWLYACSDGEWVDPRLGLVFASRLIQSKTWTLKSSSQEVCFLVDSRCC